MIVTVEDPVEYRIAGITQVPVNRAAAVTFATALRSILRQDPDIILVGEMRDPETAEIAVHAALTGHLVFSTVHTNDAVTAVTRLLDLGVADYLVASAVQGILAQRLVRRICDGCRERVEPSAASARGAEADPGWRGRGCEQCRGRGYRGRVALFELSAMDDELREQILSGGGSDGIRRVARARGARLLRDDGLVKVRRGVTTHLEIQISRW